MKRCSVCNYEISDTPCEYCFLKAENARLIRALAEEISWKAIRDAEAVQGRELEAKHQAYEARLEHELAALRRDFFDAERRHGIALEKLRREKFISS